MGGSSRINRGIHLGQVSLGEERKWLNVKHYCFDPTLTPQGKSAVTVLIKSNYDYWKSLFEDQGSYESEKQQMAAEVINHLDKRSLCFGCRML